MEGSRDASHNLHPSNELEDDSGLELSLGLACGGLRNACKASEGATGLDFIAGQGAGGVGTFERPKYVRRSGLDAALKKFLEGRLDEQDDLGRLLDEYPQHEDAWHPNGSLNKEQEKLINLGNMGSLGSPAFSTYQEKCNQLHSVSDLESGENSVRTKDIHLSDGVTTAWGQLTEQAVPLPFTDALKTGSLGESTAIMHHFAEALGREDGDKAGFQRQATLQKQDGFEQQSKFQEARKKRKDLIGEQKQQNKVNKEDDRMGPHGFRRPGSSSWVPGLDVTDPALDSEKTLLGLTKSKEGEQIHQEIRENSQLERVRVNMERSFDAEQDESTEIPAHDSKRLEKNLIPQLKSQDAGKFSGGGNGEVIGVPAEAGHLRILRTVAAVNESSGRMATTKGLHVSSSNQQEEESSALSCERAGSPSKRQNSETSCPSSSTGTDVTQKKEEQSCGDDGEASSGPPGSTGSDRLAASASTASPAKSFSVMAMPYSIRNPPPNTSGLPISVGFSFPHLRQFTPLISDSHGRSSVQAVTSSAPQLRPLQIPALEGTPSWIQVSQPPIPSLFSAPNSRVNCDWTSTGVVDGGTSRSQVAKVLEKGSGRQNATLAADNPAVEHQPLYKCVSVNFAQDQAAALSDSYQAPNLQSLTSLPVPAVPHYGPMRTLSDPGELRSFKEQGGINAFPGFAASVQAAQGLPGAPRPPSSRIEDTGARQEQAKLIGKADYAALQQVLQTEGINTAESKDLGREDFSQSFAGQFHQGTADHFPMSDGVAKELANLRPGIPSGLKFGGTGSSPDLPWVSTSGSGPNGKTVCGVLYRFSRSQVNIVCACHGKHMSPSEFVQHAGGVEGSNPEKNIVVNPFL